MVPSLRSVDPSLHRHRQREAAMADMRHHSVTPTGGEGAGLVVPHQGGICDQKYIPSIVGAANGGRFWEVL